MAAGAILKSLYTKLFHVSCVAHLLHNCALKVKSHFEDANILVAQVEISLQTTDLTTQLLKIEDLHECLVKLMETIESTKYIIKEAEQAL